MSTTTSSTHDETQQHEPNNHSQLTIPRKPFSPIRQRVDFSMLNPGNPNHHHPLCLLDLAEYITGFIAPNNLCGGASFKELGNMRLVCCQWNEAVIGSPGYALRYEQLQARTMIRHAKLVSMQKAVNQEASCLEVDANRIRVVCGISSLLACLTATMFSIGVQSIIVGVAACVSAPSILLGVSLVEKFLRDFDRRATVFIGSCVLTITVASWILTATVLAQLDTVDTTYWSSIKAGAATLLLLLVLNAVDTISCRKVTTPMLHISKDLSDKIAAIPWGLQEPPTSSICPEGETAARKQQEVLEDRRATFIEHATMVTCTTQSVRLQRPKPPSSFSVKPQLTKLSELATLKEIQFIRFVQHPQLSNLAGREVQPLSFYRGGSDPFLLLLSVEHFSSDLCLTALPATDLSTAHHFVLPGSKKIHHIAVTPSGSLVVVCLRDQCMEQTSFDIIFVDAALVIEAHQNGTGDLTGAMEDERNCVTVKMDTIHPDPSSLDVSSVCVEAHLFVDDTLRDPFQDDGDSSNLHGQTGAAGSQVLLALSLTLPLDESQKKKTPRCCRVNLFRLDVRQHSATVLVEDAFKKNANLEGPHPLKHELSQAAWHWLSSVRGEHQHHHLNYLSSSHHRRLAGRWCVPQLPFGLIAALPTSQKHKCQLGMERESNTSLFIHPVNNPTTHTPFLTAVDDDEMNRRDHIPEQNATPTTPSSSSSVLTHIGREHVLASATSITRAPKSVRDPDEIVKTIQFL